MRATRDDVPHTIDQVEDVVVRDDDVQRALNYPYVGAYESYIFSSNGKECRRIVATKEKLMSLKIFKRSRFTPMIACGSNAGYEQLMRKFSTFHCDIPVLTATIHNWAAVYAAGISPYGSMFATLGHIPRTVSNLYVLFLPNHCVDRMHYSEGITRSYVHGDRCAYVRIPTKIDVDIIGETHNTFFAYVTRPWAYERRRIVRLAAFPQDNDYISMTEEEALRRVYTEELSNGYSLDYCIQASIEDYDYRIYKMSQLWGWSIWPMLEKAGIKRNARLVQEEIT